MSGLCLLEALEFEQEIKHSSPPFLLPHTNTDGTFSRRSYYSSGCRDKAVNKAPASLELSSILEEAAITINTQIHRLSGGDRGCGE